jgi:hypothetical protein
MMKNELKQIKTTSEYIAKGGLDIGKLLEDPIRETEKALGFEGVKYNQCGNEYNAVIWMPKSQLVKIKNDFYENGASEMWICPNWLYRKNPNIGEKAA